MSWTWRPSSCGVLLLCILVPELRGQAPIEEHPEVFKPGPLTREDLERRKADELFREAQTIFGLGIMRHRGDRWLDAVNLLEQAAKLDPETPSAYRALIPLYMSLAREDDALFACRKVLERDPEDSATAYQLAKLQKADGKFREAIASLTQGVNSKRAEDHPGQHYYMLADLAEIQEKTGDLAGAMSTNERLAKHLIDQKARLIGSETLTGLQHAIATAKAYERVGHCCLAAKRYKDAVTAFEQSRDFLEKQADPDTRSMAVRLNWNLAQVFMTHEDWDNALTYLNAYLEHSPSDPEPYEKKIFVLRKLDREGEIVAAIRKYAGRVPDVLGVQLLYAKELARDPRSRKEAEKLYLALADRFNSPEVYRGLFKLYHINNQMVEVLNFIDKVFDVVKSEADIPALTREKARDRGRAMLQVLKSEPALVDSLLSVVHGELRRRLDDKEGRRFETWHFLAGMAARARKLSEAERLFRKCLVGVPRQMEAAVYSGLLEILRLQKKYDEMIALCQDALYGAHKAESTNLLLFHHNLSFALSEKEKFDEALAECDKAIKVATGAGKVVQRCRKAQFLAMAERYDASTTECDAVLKEVTEMAEINQVRHTMATIHTMKGELEKCEALYRKILEDDPNDALANNNLGYHLADHNQNLDEAEKLIRRAIEMDHIQRRDDPDDEPDNAAYLDSLGWVLFRKGKLEEARDVLEKTVALYQGAEDPTTWDHLGDVYNKLGQTKKAKEMYASALKLYEYDRRGKKEGRLEETKRKLKMLGD